MSLPSPEVLRSLGLDPKDYEKKEVKTVEELLKKPPHVILAQVFRNCDLLFDDKTKISLKKGSVMVMDSGLFLSAKRGNDDRRVHLKPYRRTFSEFFNRYRGQSLDDKHLLVWRYGGLGDLIFSQPVIKYLKEKYPTCSITYATAFKNKQLLESWPKGLIDTITEIPFNKSLLMNSDYHLTFEGFIERCRESCFQNAYDVFSKAANVQIDQTDDKYYPELLVDEKSSNKFKEIVPDNFIVVQIRATSPLRMMPFSKWKIIIEKLNELGFNIVVVDDEGYEDRYNKLFIENKMNRDKIFNLCRYSKSIKDAISVINHSHGVIAIDSSFIHIAAALKKPVVGIYAPFLAETRMKYYKDSDWVEPKESECKLFPCFLHYKRTYECPSFRAGKEITCFSPISETEVVDKFLKLVEEKVKVRESNDSTTDRPHEKSIEESSSVFSG